MGSIFEPPKKFLVDNGGEFNEDFHSLYENGKNCILTTAVELPWSNGLIGKKNSIAGYTVTKTMKDAGCDLELALSWAVAVKNSLKNINGFSPSQLVYDPVRLLQIILVLCILPDKPFFKVNPVTGLDVP